MKHLRFPTIYSLWLSACDDDKPHDDLGIGNVGGVFLVLAGGCFVAFVIATMEFLWNVEKIAIEEKAIIRILIPRFTTYRLFRLQSISDFTVGCI